MGVRFDSLTRDQTVAAITGAAARGVGGWLLTPNLDHLQRLRAEPALKPVFEAPDLIVADGMPLLWASRLAGTPLPERVAGSDLIWQVSRAAADASLRVFLLGGDPGVADRAAATLTERFPQLEVCGTHCPPFGFERDPALLAAIGTQLEQARPDIVLLGLPFPKQERLIGELRERLPSTWFLGLGVSFSFVSGDVARAPGWLRSLGLEWLHRLVQEPRRLYRRYLVDGLPFAVRLLIWSGQQRRAVRRGTQP